MFLIKMALKNLTRHKRRTLITASVIAVGLFSYLVIDSMLVGMEEMSFQNIIDLEAGHLQITDKNYWEKRDELPLKDLIYLDKNLISEIKGVSGLVEIAPRIKFNANLNNGIDELPVIVAGIEPDKERKVFTIEKYLVEGEMVSLNSYQAVIGEKIADLMEFSRGDYLTLVLRDRDGTFNTIEAEIVGIINSPDPLVNEMVFIPLNVAQKALNTDGQVAEIIIRVENEREILNIRENLALALTKWPDLTVKTWREAAESVIAMSKAQAIENQFIISIILIMAAVGIVNTVILSALERIKETGMMKAMGMKEKEIIFVFMMESTGIGIIGGVLGCLLGAVGVWLLTVYGINMAYFGMGEMDFGIPIADVFYGKWNPEAFVFVFFFGVLVALISSYLPARWAARKNPIDAIYQR